MNNFMVLPLDSRSSLALSFSRQHHRDFVPRSQHLIWHFIHKSVVNIFIARINKLVYKPKEEIKRHVTLEVENQRRAAAMSLKDATPWAP